MQERVVREIRMLRVLWRELGTELRYGLRHRCLAKAAGNCYSLVRPGRNDARHRRSPLGRDARRGGGRPLCLPEIQLLRPRRCTPPLSSAPPPEGRARGAHRLRRTTSRASVRHPQALALGGEAPTRNGVEGCAFDANGIDRVGNVGPAVSVRVGRSAIVLSKWTETM